MRTSAKSSGLSMLLAGLALALMAAVGAAADVPWVSDWAQAQRRIEQENRPAMIYFYSPKARPCRTMEEVTFRDPQVTALMGRFIPVRLEMEANPDLVRRFELMKVPTVIFFDGHSSLDTAVGYKTPEDFAGYMSRIVQRMPGTLMPAGMNRPLGVLAPPAPAPSGSVTMQPTTTLLPEGLGGPNRLNLLPEIAAPDLRQQTGTGQRVEITASLPSAQSVSLLGDFNDWKVDRPVIMNRESDGTWKAVIFLSEGVYEYMFHVDGKYITDDKNPARKPNEYGGTNSVLIVGKPGTLNPRVDASGATFYFYSPDAKRVELAGNFSDWKTTPFFANPAKPGEWAITWPSLAPGEYEYKIVVDGNWINDPESFLIRADKDRNNYFKVQ